MVDSISKTDFSRGLNLRSYTRFGYSSEDGATTTDTYRYSPYGITTAAGATPNDFRYTGREHEAEDLYYYRARYYDPTMGRFLSEDPRPSRHLRMTIHAYLYVYADPVNLIDPDGLGPCSFGSTDCLLYDGGLPENKDAPPLDERNTFTTHTTCMTKCMARRLVLGELRDRATEVGTKEVTKRLPGKSRQIAKFVCRALSIKEKIELIYEPLFYNPQQCAKECLGR